MHDRRWPWWVATACLLGSGITAGVATYRHWMPCEGSLLAETVLEPFGPRVDFSDECLRRMDGGALFPVPDVAERAPGVVALGGTAMMLAGFAWLVLVLAMRWSGRTRAVAVLPALLTLVLSGAAVVGVGAARSSSELVSVWLAAAVDVTAVAALCAIWSWETAVRGRDLLRILIMLWSVTSFGFFRLAIDLTIMMAWSSANWDVPPGTGWLTVAGLLASSVVAAVMTCGSGPGPQRVVRHQPDAGVMDSASERLRAELACTDPNSRRRRLARREASEWPVRSMRVLQRSATVPSASAVAAEAVAAGVLAREGRQHAFGQPGPQARSSSVGPRLVPAVALA
jgi:hypothetical protein